MFIVTKKINSENIRKVCRTCLREDNDKMMYLFVGPAESSLAAKLQSFSCLKVSQGDGLPEKMCDKCVIRAESALLFREQCQAADKALRQAVISTADISDVYTCPNTSINQLDNQSLEVPQNLSAKKLTNYKTCINHKQFYMHNQFCPEFYEKEENIIPQNSHVIKSHNDYINFNYPNTSNNQILINKSSIIKSDNLDTTIKHHDLHCKTSCMSQCSLCNYTFSSKMQFINHNSITHTEDHVNHSFNDKINIEIIKSSNTTEKNICKRSVSHLTEHSVETVAYSTANLECRNEVKNSSLTNDDMREVSSTYSAVINKVTDEISNKDSPEINKNKRLQCETCNQIFNKKSKLIIHQMTHANEKYFECIYCGKCYSSKSKLAAHTRLHTQTNIHQCNICQKIFAYPSYLSEHEKIHCPKQVKKASFECIQCKKQFYHAKSYKRHMKFHTGKDLFRCDICNKLFNQKHALKVHMRAHEKTKFHKCEICDKAFNQKSNLIEHIRIHTKIKPFKCKICEKSFAQSSHLKIHEVTHNSIRRFQCKICGKRFKLSNHLKRHTDLHTGIKMYRCNQCNQTFSQAFSLKRHAKKHAESDNL